MVKSIDRESANRIDRKEAGVMLEIIALVLAVAGVIFFPNFPWLPVAGGLYIITTLLKAILELLKKALKNQAG